MKLGWGFVVVAALALAGCDASFGRCSERDDAGLCIFDDDDDFPGLDGSFGSDAGDAGVRADSGSSAVGDAGLGGMDASASLDSGGGGTSLSETAFCEAQYQRARAWLDLTSRDECNCLSGADRSARDEFLALVLRYRDDTIVTCLNNIDRFRDAGVSYEPAQAAACASAYANQFAAPPATCPSGGFDVEALEGSIGHGAQNLVQLPACRATLVGKIAVGAACTNSLECQAGLRCLTIPGGGSKTCESARAVGGPCESSSDCADGHICSGGTQAGLTCIPVSQLRLQGGPCQVSPECIDGLVCRSGICATPQPDVICTP